MQNALASGLHAHKGNGGWASLINHDFVRGNVKSTERKTFESRERKQETILRERDKDKFDTDRGKSFVSTRRANRHAYVNE